MAPDLNAVAAGEKWTYDAPGSKGYDIPDVVLNHPENRRLKVLTIGAGVSGILMAYQIQKRCKNVEHVIYEKNSDIGGTWLENRYPGCACDIPSHAYTYNFALNPEWPQYFSYSPDIKAYLDRVVDCFDLRKYMTFDSEITGCYWQEKEGKWLVKIRQQLPGEEPKEIEDTCDLLLHATGILNNYKWPDLPGMDKFKGKLVHTARWPKDYQKEQWKDDTVAVIGSGASSIQTVPTMLNSGVKHMDVFVRTGIWFVEIAANYGDNKPYPPERQEEFKKDPHTLVAHGKELEDQVNGLWGLFYSDSPMQGMAQELFKARMAEFIKDERLLKGFTPKFGVGCRRVTPGDPYMLAIQKENVDVHFTGVKALSEHGVIGDDDVERKVDTVVCATGFDVSYRPRFPLVGRSGMDLKEKWALCPEGYLGLGIPDFPNFITFVGPTWPVENGSVIGPLKEVSEYALQIIKKMQYENVHSWAPRQDITDEFNEHSQEWIKHTVWKDDCRAWYRNNETGRVNAVWPGSSLHYIHTIHTPRYEDFDMKYHNKQNRFAYLGMGKTIESVFGAQTTARADLDNAAIAAAGEAELSEEEKKKREEEAFYVDGKPKPLDPLTNQQQLDKSPYLAMQNLDPRWLVKACGVPLEKAKEMVIEAAAQEAARAKRWEIEMELMGLGGSTERSMSSRVV